MNNSDKKLTLIILLITISVLIFQRLNNSNNKLATIFYEDKIILKIDLSQKELQEFDVKGYNGNVHIIAIDGKIKVEDENSKNHICSKQGYISAAGESLVCLPNKIVIKIDSKDVDTILR